MTNYKFDRLISIIIPWRLYSCRHDSYAIVMWRALFFNFLSKQWLYIIMVTNWISLSTLRSCYKYRWCLASYPGSSPGYEARWCLLGIINYRDTVYCFSIHWYMEIHYIIVPMHFHRVQHREHLLTPLPATDPGGTITMVTASGRSFIQQINTEDTAVQETNPATLGQLVLANWSITVKY